jgi:adenosine kinase
MVVVTQGAGSVLIGNSKGVTEHQVPALDEGSVKDYYGRGDAFTGGFLSQLAQGKDEATCAKFGIHMAQEVLKQPFCNLPSDMTCK